MEKSVYTFFPCEKLPKDESHSASLSSFPWAASAYTRSKLEWQTNSPKTNPTVANPLRLLLISECIPCFGAKTLSFILWQHNEIAKDALQGSLKLNEARTVDE